jgi:hypothetical protein
MPMFRLTNILFSIHLISQVEDYEAVYTIDIYCATCSFDLRDMPLDKWLEIGFPLVLRCPQCNSHTMINFYELETQLDQLANAQSAAQELNSINNSNLVARTKD